MKWEWEEDVRRRRETWRDEEGNKKTLGDERGLDGKRRDVGIVGERGGKWRKDLEEGGETMRGAWTTAVEGRGLG